MNRDLVKVQNVIKSCITSEQLDTAINMLYAYNSFYDPAEEVVEEVIKQANAKGEELWEKENPERRAGFRPY